MSQTAEVPEDVCLQRPFELSEILTLSLLQISSHDVLWSTNTTEIFSVGPFKCQWNRRHLRLRSSKWVS